jgi:hypothetical protein
MSFEFANRVCVWIFIFIACGCSRQMSPESHVVPSAKTSVAAEIDPTLHVLSPAELVAAFRADKPKAEAKFWKRFISVRGVVCPPKWKSKHPQLYLDAGDNYVLGCEFDESDRSQVNLLNPGDTVILRGWCSNLISSKPSDYGDGMPGVLSLFDCEIEHAPEGLKGFNLANPIPAVNK